MSSNRQYYHDEYETESQVRHGPRKGLLLGRLALCEIFILKDRVEPAQLSEHVIGEEYQKGEKGDVRNEVVMTSHVSHI
jgi:hypothetical protein